MNAMLAPPHPSLRFADLHLRRRRNLRSSYPPGQLRLTYNARAAFYQLLCALRASEQRTILLPAFHCTALVEPVVRAGFAPRFYRILPDFRSDMNDVRRKTGPDVAAIVVIHYFGFQTPLGPFLELRDEFGCKIVEDCAHSFLTQNGDASVGHAGDFSLFSFYKFAPTLAGGGLGINGAQPPAMPEPPAVPWREQLALAKRLFEQALQNSPRNPVSKLLLNAERWRVHRRQSKLSAVPRASFVDDPYLFREDLANSAMPLLSRRLLESNDWSENVAARRRNYALYSEEIRDTLVLKRVFPDLPTGVCPWAFPVLLLDRAAHEKQLRALGVPLYTFGEVLHPLLSQQNDSARADAECLSSQLLLLPVHVLVDSGTVKQIARLIDSYLESLHPGSNPIRLDQSKEKPTHAGGVCHERP